MQPFEPQEAKKRQAAVDAAKSYAQAVRDWHMLDDAVDQEISDQRNLVEWWDENVGVRESPGDNQHKRSVADQRPSISVETAETITEFTKQTISKFRIQDAQHRCRRI